VDAANSPDRRIAKIFLCGRRPELFKLLRCTEFPSSERPRLNWGGSHSRIRDTLSDKGSISQNRHKCNANCFKWCSSAMHLRESDNFLATANASSGLTLCSWFRLAFGETQMVRRENLRQRFARVLFPPMKQMGSPLPGSRSVKPRTRRSALGRRALAVLWAHVGPAECGRPGSKP
jgi:hypothetical protein